MVDLNGFNAANVEPNVGFTPIPTDDYKMTITNSENKPTRAGNGSYLKLELTVADGEYIGRKVFANLNLDNPNPQAVEIAKGDLSAICRAVGVMAPRDSVELHNLPLMCKVIVEARNDKPTEMTNTIKGFAAVQTRSVAEAQKGQPPAGTPDDTPPYAPQSAGNQAPPTGVAGW